jgi:hypothetical protein
MHIWIALLVAVIGLVLWLIPAPNKVNTFGFVLFCCGTGATLLLLGGRAVGF